MGTSSEKTSLQILEKTTAADGDRVKTFAQQFRASPYFLKVLNAEDLLDSWERKILPLLLDLCRSSTKKSQLQSLLSWQTTSEDHIKKFTEQGMTLLEESHWPYKEMSFKTGTLSEKNLNSEQLLIFFALICQQVGGN